MGLELQGRHSHLCNAEKGSGLTLAKDMPKVVQWLRDNLETPEGNTFFSSLTDAKLTERGKKLQSESEAVGLPACPTVAAYERLAAQAEYRADLQHLCSSLTLPKVAEKDDDGRLTAIEDWIDKQARSPRTKELAEPLRSAPPAGRAKLLRDKATEVDVFTCELARTLEMPPVLPKAGGVPVVRLREPPKVNGPLSEEDVTKALVAVTPAMTECYRKGLENKPDLAGEIALKVQANPEGKVIRAAPFDSKVDDTATLACIVEAIKGATMPKNPGPLVSIVVPLELSAGARHP